MGEMITKEDNISYLSFVAENTNLSNLTALNYPYRVGVLIKVG